MRLKVVCYELQAHGMMLCMCYSDAHALDLCWWLQSALQTLVQNSICSIPHMEQLNWIHCDAQTLAVIKAGFQQQAQYKIIISTILTGFWDKFDNDLGIARTPKVKSKWAPACMGIECTSTWRHDVPKHNSLDNVKLGDWLQSLLSRQKNWTCHFLSLHELIRVQMKQAETCTTYLYKPCKNYEYGSTCQNPCKTYGKQMGYKWQWRMLNSVFFGMNPMTDSRNCTCQQSSVNRLDQRNISVKTGCFAQLLGIWYICTCPYSVMLRNTPLQHQPVIPS